MNIFKKLGLTGRFLFWFLSIAILCVAVVAYMSYTSAKTSLETSEVESLAVMAEANDTQRQSDVNTILNAINSYAADNKGALPVGIGTTALIIKNSGGVDLCSTLTPKYIASMPFDPTTGSYTSCTTYDTGYTVLKSATNSRVTVSATPEVVTSITVTR